MLMHRKHLKKKSLELTGSFELEACVPSLQLLLCSGSLSAITRVPCGKYRSASSFTPILKDGKRNSLSASNLLNYDAVKRWKL